MKKPLIIFGAGKIAEVAYYYQSYTESGNQVIAFTCDEEYIPNDLQFLGLPVIPFCRSDLERFWQDNNYDGAVRISLPLSYKEINSVRASKYLQAKTWGFDCPSYVHPSVMIFPNSTVGDNCFILESNVVQPGVKIGNNVVIWSHCHIGHHSELGDHSWITSGAVICSSVMVEQYAFVGAGAIIRDNISIGERSVVGMGSVITKSTRPGQVYLSGTNNLLTKRTSSIEL